MKKLFVGLLVVTSLWGEYKGNDYSKLTIAGLDSSLIQTHVKLYQGYVNQVNSLEKLLIEERSKSGGTSSFTYQSIKRRFGWEFNGMVLHELYFDNLARPSMLNINGPLYQTIEKQFGSFEQWKQDFMTTCQIRGIGWAILSVNVETGQMHNIWVQEHDIGVLVKEIPLLVFDLWEHAYLCQFTLDRMSYATTLFQSIDWSLVEKRMNYGAGSKSAY